MTTSTGTTAEVPTPLTEVAIDEARNELTDFTVYQKLASQKKESSAVFAKLSTMEYKHFRFWSKYTEGRTIRPKMLTVYFVLLMRQILGDSFVIKFLEHREASTAAEYEALRGSIPAEDREPFNQMVDDEKGHETSFAEEVQEQYVKYISFIILGLSDALVEIAGIHAGSLGIYSSTKLSGLAGIVAGAAASLAMSSAAYAQAKQGFQGSARLAAAYTGASYFACAVGLALPYFLTSVMVLAISSSVCVGIVIIAFVSWYNSIMSGSVLKDEFFQFAGIMLGATLALFVFGVVIRIVFGITV